MATIEELSQKVNDLTALVQRQANLLTKTGQQVLDLQVKDTRSKLDRIPSLSANQTLRNQARSDQALDTTEFATNEDIVQLVGELQGQLEFLEDRSIRRLFNATKTEKTDRLAAVPNTDGDLPSEFPKSLEEFSGISVEKVIELMHFYDILPQTKQDQERLALFMEGKISNPNQGAAAHVPTKNDFSEAEFDAMFDDLARYLGLQERRSAGAW